ncbi:hypothetical protein [Microbacterium rhizophilus]|uniref:hypothetical protein n=1 Tax=Microbacterium rhizophilus TaxID=3138934 RepID=UPI0031F04C04
MSRMMVLGRWVRYALLAVVGIAAIAWIVTIPIRAEVVSAPAPAASVEPAVVVTPTPTATADPRRRFLALDGGGVLWRGTAGSCAEGIAPKLERTADAVTWRVATPGDAAELLALTPGDAVDQASVVIATGDGSCTVAGRHTNSEGDAWEESPKVDVPTLPEGALAVTEGGYVARETEGCDGVAFSGDSWETCETGMDPADPIAIDYADGRLYVWSGDVLAALEVG